MKETSLFRRLICQITKFVEASETCRSEMCTPPWGNGQEGRRLGSALTTPNKLGPSSTPAALYTCSKTLQTAAARPLTMPSYTVTISTGSQWFAGTDDYIYITLVGTEQCSERTLLDKPLYNDFERGAVSGERPQQNDSLLQLWTVGKR